MTEFNNIDSAPKNGQMIWLLMKYYQNETGGGCYYGGPLAQVEEKAWTLGFNNFEHDGLDTWNFVAWNWAQDQFEQGCNKCVKPIGWKPLGFDLADPTFHVPKDHWYCESCQKIVSWDILPPWEDEYGVRLCAGCIPSGGKFDG